MLSAGELAELLADWMDELEARNLSPNTRKTYRDGVTAFLRWAEAEGREPALDQPAVIAFTAAVLGTSERAAATAHSRQVAVRRFSKWLAKKEIIPADLLQGIEAVSVGESALRPLSDEQLAALFRACAGKDFTSRRDRALIRLMCETGLRASEAAGLQLADVDQRARTVAVRGKGGKFRIVTYGPQTASTVNDYLRARRAHHPGEGGPLWIGRQGRPVGYDLVYTTVKRRMLAAGIPVSEATGFTPHSLRRTWAVRWKHAGGSEAGLMAIGGWRRLESVAPYVRAASARLAAEEAARLNLGDL